MGPDTNFEQELRRRIREAKKILGSDCDENEIKKSLLNTRTRAQYQNPVRPVNKKQKGALKRFGKSLRRLIDTLKDENLMSYARKRMTVDNLREHLQHVEKLASFPLPRRGPPSRLQREAVRQSAILLELHNIPRTTSRQAQALRLGSFPRPVALL